MSPRSHHPYVFKALACPIAVVFGQTVNVMASSVMLLSIAAVGLSVGAVVSATSFAGLRRWCWRCGHHHLSKWRTLESHAQTTEKQFPAFRGRLHLAMQAHIEGAAFLVERTRDAVVELLSARTPSEVHSARPLKQSVQTLVAAVAILLVLEVFLPVTPSAALAAFQSGHLPLAKGPNLEDVSTDKAVLLGDISLRYTFPEHTRMTPIDVPNSDGTIHGPVGSQVLISARADAAFKAAALVINDSEPRPIVLTNGRNVQFQIDIVSDGQWRLVFQDATKEWFSTATFPIQIDDDDPPIGHHRSTISEASSD